METNQGNSLAIIDKMDMRTVEETTRKINEFQTIVRNNLKENKDYGKIPGTSKPTLLKPGAEKILMLMGLQSTYDILDSTRDFEKGFFQYQVRCTLKKGDVIITQGMGSCNSREKKYIKQDPYTIDNTILKMAKKRSQVDAVLTVASLSEIFTQDVEDLGFDSEESYQRENGNGKQAKKSDQPATEKQVALISKQIMGSHLLNDDEKNRLSAELDCMTKDKASEIISWWLGKDDKPGERSVREAKEKKEKAKVKYEEEGE